MHRQQWMTQQHGRKAVLYVVKLYGNEGEPAFYKIGITFNLTQRFRTLRFAGYKWRTVARFSSWDAGKVFDLEQRLHGAGFVPYAPLLDFSGRTECYAAVEGILEALPKVGTFVLRNQVTEI
ncbi:GIY-YIG nuclease family protein [Hymenobacter properus]|uniref:GIY-YIG nuclease family protein n=1 Tax=Hymenobacter properus TaxID=2791026 RepID=A0A931FKC3_9BACT|nr:GIY-YIG nuclease family protein [Hymenobacter properus]MBF9140851.1 GIY-YIG nuclease family protein [Hymenobacter properus]MBR7719660.1 GIY-YIG nuclease family protein [Microvirga sp. SRT04]